MLCSSDDDDHDAPLDDCKSDAGPYLTGPSGYPSPDPTGMGYMMDGQQAAAAAMMHARPPGDAGYDYPHPAAAYSQYYSHL